jgi:low temperature requirement protein LtrA
MRGHRTWRPRRRVPPSLLQDHSGEQRVTNIELFSGLVYVLGVTQMSHHLLAKPDVQGRIRRHGSLTPFSSDVIMIT